MVDSGNGLVLTGDKSLLEPMVTKMHDASDYQIFPLLEKHNENSDLKTFLSIFSFHQLWPILSHAAFTANSWHNHYCYSF